MEVGETDVVEHADGPMWILKLQPILVHQIIELFEENLEKKDYHYDHLSDGACKLLESSIINDC